MIKKCLYMGAFRSIKIEKDKIKKIIELFTKTIQPHSHVIDVSLLEAHGIKIQIPTSFEEDLLNKILMVYYLNEDINPIEASKIL